MSHIIFFIATLIALSIAVSAISVALKSLSYAMSQKTEISARQISTVIKIVEGSFLSDQNILRIYLKNLGETSLEINKLDIFVDGSFAGRCNDGTNSCLDEDGDLVLMPEEVAEVNVPFYLSSGSHDIKVVTQYGVYAEYEVVVE